MFQKIKDTFFDVVGDFKSTIFHAEDLLFNSSTKNIRKFYAFVIFILAIIIFRSNSVMAFYTNLLVALFCSIVSYYIFCLSDYFWYLITAQEAYNGNIRNKININILVKWLPYKVGMEEDSYKKQILSTVKLYTETRKIHIKRYVFEIGILLLILLLTYPLFFLVNIGIFIGMLFYIIYYDKQSTAQVFNNIALLLNCINELYKEDPEKCKRFILNNKKEEIKELKMLYQAVLKIE